MACLSQGPRLPLLLWALSSFLLRALGKSVPLQFSQSLCLSNPKYSSISLSPYIFKPAPNTYCFTLQHRVTPCSSGPCCKHINITNFVLNANPGCDDAVVTATLNNVPLPRVTITRPRGAVSSAARLVTVPALNLTPKAAAGARLCLKLPSSGKCSSFYKLARGGSAWTASLSSSDAKCCPMSRGKSAPKPPKGSCQSCFVWDVLGPKRTPESAEANLFSRNSCMLVQMEDHRNVSNCCMWATRHIQEDFDRYRRMGYILRGFDRPYCDRTSIRMCGVLASPEKGRAMIKDWDTNGDLAWQVLYAFDVDDEWCPMALMNSTIRFYSAEPGSSKLDAKCAPFKYEIEQQCVEPDKDAWELNGADGEDDVHRFPNATCDSTAGVMPFRVDKYLEVTFGSKTNMYCVKIEAAKPADPKSKCGQVNRVDRLSFWVNQKYFGDSTRSVQLMTLKDGEYSSQRLTTSWGVRGDNALFTEPLGLNLSNVTKLKPKVCFERNRYAPLSDDTVDGNNFLWTAIHDSSGHCCPTYYSNTF